MHILKSNCTLCEREKSALGLARYCGHGCSRLQPFFGRLGHPDGFAYYMEGQWQGHLWETCSDLRTVQAFDLLNAVFCMGLLKPVCW